MASGRPSVAKPTFSLTWPRMLVARRGPRAFLLGTGFGTVTLFAISGVATLVLCTACLAWAEQLQTFAIDSVNASEGAEAAAAVAAANGHMQDINTRSSWTMLFFQSYTYFIDPGAQSEFRLADETQSVYSSVRVASVVTFSLVGFVWSLTAFGVLVESVGVSMKRQRRRHAMIAVRDHILILGWTDKTLFMIRELAQMLSDGVRGGGTIVVLGDFDTEQMREDVDTVCMLVMTRTRVRTTHVRRVRVLLSTRMCVALCRASRRPQISRTVAKGAPLLLAGQAARGG